MSDLFFRIMLTGLVVFAATCFVADRDDHANDPECVVFATEAAAVVSCAAILTGIIGIIWTVAL